MATVLCTSEAHQDAIKQVHPYQGHNYSKGVGNTIPRYNASDMILQGQVADKAFHWLILKQI